MVSLLTIGGGNLTMANYLKENDTLAAGYPKINAAIGQAEQSKINSDNAVDTANSAVATANQALASSHSTQEQLNQIVIDGDSSVEAAQARVNADNTVTYATLKERLDTENQGLNSQLADIAINVMDYGVLGDGTDETEKVMDALLYAVDNHKTLYIPHDMTVLVDVLKVENKTNFKINIAGTLKSIADASYTDPLARSLLIFQGCNDFEIIEYNADMDVANNGVTIKEHRHMLELVNCKNVKLGYIHGINLSGDGVYIANCDGIVSDVIKMKSSFTGRNAVSIISGHQMEFNIIISDGIGTKNMPSGVGLEPNNDTDGISDIQFNIVYITSIGTGGFTVTNNFNADCQEVIANNVIVIKNPNYVADMNGTGVIVNGFKHVKINAIVKEIQADKNNLKSFGFNVDGSEDVELNIDVSNAFRGGVIGFTKNVNNLKLTGSLKNTVYHGVAIALCSNSDIDMTMTDSNYTGLSTVNILFESACVINNIKINGMISKGAHGFKAFYLPNPSTSTYNDITINADIEGYSDEEIFTGVTSNVLKLKMKRLVWYPLTLESGWTPIVDTDVPSYAITQDRKVIFNGALTGGTNTLYATVASLPVNIVPANTHYIDNVYIQGNLIRLNTAGITNISLNTISYYL